MVKINKKSVGEYGEKAAVKFLNKNKYRILHTNYKTKIGEIDIICENKEYIVFVEVKTRKKGADISGIYAVNPTKQNHIIRTAHYYLSNNETEKQPRFDIIEVEYDENYKFYVKEFYIDAFWQGGDYGVF